MCFPTLDIHHKSVNPKPLISFFFDGVRSHPRISQESLKQELLTSLSEFPLLAFDFCFPKDTNIWSFPRVNSSDTSRLQKKKIEFYAPKVMPRHKSTSLECQVLGARLPLLCVKKQECLKIMIL
jgi:hypothetical protein